MVHVPQVLPTNLAKQELWDRTNRTAQLPGRGGQRHNPVFHELHSLILFFSDRQLEQKLLFVLASVASEMK
jgi:hypothetical protein